MFEIIIVGFLALGLVADLARCQYFPPTPENVTVLRSRFNSDITISYKEVSARNPSPEPEAADHKIPGARPM
jgi:hypothetical protein